MDALLHFAFGALYPTWQHIKLLILFEQLFVSSEFKSFVLFHDNATVDLANTLLVRLADRSPQHHDIVVYNIDRHQPVQRHYGLIVEPLVPEALSLCFARSVSVELFVDHDALSVLRFRMDVYRLRPRTKWIRVYLGPTRHFVNYYRYMALIELTDNDMVKLSTYNYQQRQPLKLFNESPLTMYQQLFYDQRIDMLGVPLYMWGDMDAPNLFRATTFDARGKRVQGVAGLYAAICKMIGQYFNASIGFAVYNRRVGLSSGGGGGGLRGALGRLAGSRSMAAAAASAEAKAEMEEDYEAYERLRKRVYLTNSVMPGVENAMVHCNLYDEFMAIGHAMYPHRQENYVVLVPNEHQRPPELWLVLASSPLMTVWMGAITNFTLARCVIRLVERRRRRRYGAHCDPIPSWDIDRLMLETCGLSFGGAIALRPAGRADRVLLLSVSVFAIVSCVICSGVLLKQFAFGDRRPKVDTLADLNRLANVTVVLPYGLAVHEATWNENHTLMHASLAVIYGEILKKNTKCTFVLPESVADVLLAEKHMSEDNGNFPVFHKLRERVLAMHMSLYTTHDIITHHLNLLVQRMRYQGLISHFEKESQFALGVRGSRIATSAMSPSEPTSSTKLGGNTIGSSSSITLRELSFIMWLVLCGQLISVAVFGAELLVARMLAVSERTRAKLAEARFWFLN